MDHRPKWKTQNYKILDDNTGENLDDSGYSNDFCNYNTKGMIHKVVIEKLNFIKIKNFCSTKDIVKRIRQATDWEKIFEKVILIQ